MAWAEAYLHDTKWHLGPSSRMATIDMGRKLGVCAPFSAEGELGGRGLPPCQVPSLYIDLSSRLATIRMGRKLGAVLPLLGGSWVRI